MTASRTCREFFTRRWLLKTYKLPLNQATYIASCQSNAIRHGSWQAELDRLIVAIVLNDDESIEPGTANYPFTMPNEEDVHYFNEKIHSQSSCTIIWSSLMKKVNSGRSIRYPRICKKRYQRYWLLANEPEFPFQLDALTLLSARCGFQQSGCISVRDGYQKLLPSPKNFAVRNQTNGHRGKLFDQQLAGFGIEYCNGWWIVP